MALSDARARQLHGLSRALVASSPLYAVGFVLVTAASAMWSATAVWYGQPTGIFATKERDISLSVLGAILTVLVALPGAIVSFRETRRLRGVTEALPPLRVGDSAACRVCGAALTGGSGVIRCKHCAADNVVDAKLLARAGGRRESDLRDVESEAIAGASEIGQTRTFGLAVTATMSLLAVPFVTIIYGDRLLGCLRGTCFEREPPSPAAGTRGPPPVDFATPPAPVDSGGRTGLGRALLGLDAGVAPADVCEDYVRFRSRCGAARPNGEELEKEMIAQCILMRDPWDVRGVQCYLEAVGGGGVECAEYRRCTSASR